MESQESVAGSVTSEGSAERQIFIVSYCHDSNFHPVATLFVAVHINYTRGLPEIVPTLEFLSTR